MRGSSLAEEDLLELHHPRVGEQQGRVALGNDRSAAHNPVVTGREEIQKARSNLSTGRHLALVVLSEYLAHDFRWMSAADEEPVRLGSLGSRCRHGVPEPPSERDPPEGDLAPAFEHTGNRTIDDGTGETPASQFVGHLEASGTPPQQQVLGAPFGERGIVDDATRREGSDRRLHERFRDAPSGEVTRDLGVRPRRMGQIRNGDGHGSVGACDGSIGAFDSSVGAVGRHCPEARSDRS